ncbi:MAG: alpha/beta hydrolase [Actinomycetota bacterium]|nr:alpha/beta hydrolase [Actinomycetota bacterium]
MALTRSGNADIWWESRGSGSPVLLINGLSSPSSVWFRLAPLLATDHRVLTFDNLGTGRSSTPDEQWSMADMVAAAVAVIQASGETRVSVLGISMGGLIAQELTLGHPDLVAHLVLVATGAGMAHTTGDPEAAAAIRSAGSLPSDERLAFILPFTYARETPQALMKEDEAVRALQPTSELAYQRQLAAVVPWDRLSDLATIGCPTLVLHGEQDRLISVASAEVLRDAIPGAQLTVLPRAGHQLFTDQPDAGSQAVLTFLKDSTG